MATANNTELTRVSRLAERAANYRGIAKQVKRSGVINALTGAAKGINDFANRY
ncbi:MAG: hypothetical protein U5K75_00125 [Ahrensia sp.]|nr:hypothetical protein [Ahrensia sp.]